MHRSRKTNVGWFKRNYFAVHSSGIAPPVSRASNQCLKLHLDTKIPAIKLLYSRKKQPRGGWWGRLGGNEMDMVTDKKEQPPEFNPYGVLRRWEPLFWRDNNWSPLPEKTVLPPRQKFVILLVKVWSLVHTQFNYLTHLGDWYELANGVMAGFSLIVISTFAIAMRRRKSPQIEDSK